MTVTVLMAFTSLRLPGGSLPAPCRRRDPPFGDLRLGLAAALTAWGALAVVGGGTLRAVAAPASLATLGLALGGLGLCLAVARRRPRRPADCLEPTA